MKSIIRAFAATAIVSLIGFAGASCQNHDEKPTTAPTTKMAAAKPTTGPTTKVALGKPVNKFCAIETDNEVDPKVSILYKDKVIGFCCESCIKDFNKDPEKYVKAMK